MEDSKIVSSKKMDLDISNIQRILNEVKFPSSVQDLKSPTEQYVVNLMYTFLKRFNINIASIERPTMEQQDLMLGLEPFEDSDMIRLINLHVTMAGISSHIFVNDLCITDITSPGSKRFRRQAKFFANFVVYVNYKESIIQKTQYDINEKKSILQNILDQRADVQRAIVEKEQEIRKNLALKEQIIPDIKDMELSIEKKLKEDKRLMAEVNPLKEKEHQTLERHKDLTNRYFMLGGEIGNLQSEIVNTPEKHETRLRGLMAQRRLKIENRDGMTKTFQDKLQSINHIEKYLSYVEQLTNELNHVQQVYEDLKQESIQSDMTEDKLKIMRENIQELQAQKESEMCHREQIENQVKELCAEQEKLRSSIYNCITLFQGNKITGKAQQNEAQIRWNEAQSERTELRSKTEKLESEILTFTKGCQELYDNELESEAELRKA